MLITVCVVSNSAVNSLCYQKMAGLGAWTETICVCHVLQHKFSFVTTGLRIRKCSQESGGCVMLRCSLSTWFISNIRFCDTSNLLGKAPHFESVWGGLRWRSSFNVVLRWEWASSLTLSLEIDFFFPFSRNFCYCIRLSPPHIWLQSHMYPTAFVCSVLLRHSRRAVARGN
jgi:hypothetical protein